MISLSLSEAQLMRLLCDIFGPDRVIPHMSAFAVCGGELPKGVSDVSGELRRWARANKCLFTVIDAESLSVLVVEFFSGFGRVIDPIEAEHQRFLKPLLKAAGIRYVTLSEDEFEDILDPHSEATLATVIASKVEELDVQGRAGEQDTVEDDQGPY